jgi:hypothetical protein
VSLYLINEGRKSVLTGAIIIANLFNVKDNIPFFRKVLLGAYNLVMGYMFSLVLKEKLQESKPYIQE